MYLVAPGTLDGGKPNMIHTDEGSSFSFAEQSLLDWTRYLTPAMVGFDELGMNTHQPRSAHPTPKFIVSRRLSLKSLDNRRPPSTRTCWRRRQGFP